MKLTTRQKINPNWFWLAFIPVIGGSAIVYAGWRTQTRNWVILGLGLVFINLLYSSNQLLPFVWFWLIQIAAAFYLRKKYVKKISRSLTGNFLDLETKTLEHQEKIEINSCSKDEMVYQLGLPIVYANNIELLRLDGYIFTDLEELSDIAGIPKNYLAKLKPLITFRYHLEQEDLSWRRVNSYSKAELIRCGLTEKVAQEIIEEREKNGSYHSVIDIKQRTGLSLQQYRDII